MVRQTLAGLSAALLALSVPTLAEWQFSAEAVPVAHVHAEGMALELYCDSLHITPADEAGIAPIANKGGLLLGFMQDERTESGGFQAASENASQKPSTPMEAPEGVVYCGGGAIKRQIEYIISPRSEGEWDARVTVNGETMKAMTSYSYFGDSEPANFVVALLAEDRGEFLVFSDGRTSWLEFGDYTYRQCN